MDLEGLGELKGVEHLFFLFILDYQRIKERPRRRSLFHLTLLRKIKTVLYYLTLMTSKTTVHPDPNKWIIETLVVQWNEKVRSQRGRHYRLDHYEDRSPNNPPYLYLLLTTSDVSHSWVGDNQGKSRKSKMRKSHTENYFPSTTTFVL